MTHCFYVSSAWVLGCPPGQDFLPMLPNQSQATVQSRFSNDRAYDMAYDMLLWRRTCMLNSMTGPVLPMPIAPPMSTTSILSTTSGYSITNSACRQHSMPSQHLALCTWAIGCCLHHRQGHQHQQAGGRTGEHLPCMQEPADAQES